MEDLTKMADLHREMGDVYDKLYDSLAKNQDQAERIRYLESRLSEEIDNRHAYCSLQDAAREKEDFARQIGYIITKIERVPEFKKELCSFYHQKIQGIKIIRTRTGYGLLESKIAWEIWAANLSREEHVDEDPCENPPEDDSEH